MDSASYFADWFPYYIRGAVSVFVASAVDLAE
jgi:hypothetical protein